MPFEGPGLDTIVAVATPPGRGALAIVRISGPDTSDVLRRIVPDLGDDPPVVRSPTLCAIADPGTGAVIDRGLVTWFPGPGSYTGEDSAELSIHGGPLLSALVLDACVRAGTRRARAGEFTQRAYLNGKVDLVQAEAVHDLIQAESEAGRRAALVQMEGGLSRRVAALRERLVQVEALLSHHVDFPEEDEPPVSRQRIADEAAAVAGDLSALVRTAPEGELLREGALVVLAGRPNAGKSSLLNALLGQERAIVTPEPGTTRDAIEARLSLGGFPFVLVDTAGIRDESEVVERLGIEVARRYLDRADLALFCVPCDAGWSGSDEAFLDGLSPTLPVVLLRTMSDRVSGSDASGPRVSGPWESGANGADARSLAAVIDVSAVDGTGLDEIRRTLPSLVYRGLVGLTNGAPVLTRRRQREAAAQALDEVCEFVEGLRGGVDAEVAATHLRSAESALEELVGVISGDEVLERVFREFCIGK